MENMFFVSATIACVVFTLHILYSIYVINKQNKKINSYLKQDSEPMWKEIKVKTEQKEEEKKEKRHYKFSCQWIKVKGNTFYWFINSSNGKSYLRIKIQRTKWKEKSYLGKINRLLNKYGKIITKEEYDEAKYDKTNIDKSNAEFWFNVLRENKPLKINK